MGFNDGYILLMRPSPSFSELLMPNQKFAEIAQKLRRVERMIGGLAKDAEEKARIFHWSAEHGSGEVGKGAKPSRNQAGSAFDRLALARLLLTLKERRHDHLDAQQTSNISWEILLALFAEGEGGKKGLSTKSLCLTAKVPLTTGNRWISSLEEEGLVRRYGVEDDQRLSMVELSPAGALMMEQYLDSAGGAIYEMFIDMKLETVFDGVPVQ